METGSGVGAAGEKAASYALPNPLPDPAWLARRVEPILDPDLPIIDAHHHLWDAPHPRYLLDEIVADVASGHRIVATVFVEAESMYRAGGPEALRPVGEVEFAAGIAAMSTSGRYGPTRLCAGIVAHADLGLGVDVEPVLDALERAGGGRLRGVRHSFGHDPAVRMHWPAGLLARPAFREGFARLQARGLGFDAWMYHPQLPDLLALLEAQPEAHVVLNHLGGRIGVGPYARRSAEVEAGWRRDLVALARFPNVSCKLGGLGMAMAGYGFHQRPEPPSSEELASAWGPAMREAIDLFGPSRCLFESNFPVDKASCSYAILWNAFKRIASRYAPTDRADLFSGSAARIYRIA